MPNYTKALDAGNSYHTGFGGRRREAAGRVLRAGRGVDGAGWPGGFAGRSWGRRSRGRGWRVGGGSVAGRGFAATADPRAWTPSGTAVRRRPPSASIPRRPGLPPHIRRTPSAARPNNSTLDQLPGSSAPLSVPEPTEYAFGHRGASSETLSALISGGSGGGGRGERWRRRQARSSAGARPAPAGTTSRSRPAASPTISCGTSRPNRTNSAGVHEPVMS
jgi:hypothetical protein